MNTQTVPACLAELYGESHAANISSCLEKQIAAYVPCIPEESLFTPTAEDVVLITYGDMVHASGEKPLQVLHALLNDCCRDIITTVHLLPFFPYSSDDGFSVIDYRQVNPDLGTWDDIMALSRDFSLAFDAVFNHISAQSNWFKKYLDDDPHYRGFFIEIEPGTDLSMVVRPRALPLLTPVSVANRGEKLVWTTFSADQVDLNLHTPDVLVELIDILFFYITHGARLIRLDAIAYLWKEPGTPCIHLPETHNIIKLFRLLLEEYAPQVGLLVEANVPHRENISYFGDCNDEAHMVYQFPLPPLTAHALLRENAGVLTRWVEELEEPSGDHTFLNFLASHDGIGVRPAAGYLDDAEIRFLVDTCLQRGGNAGEKHNSDGTTSPYELNINYLSLFIDGDEDLAINKFIVAHSILLCMPGVPGLYFHSLFGSVNDPQGVKRTGMFRSINREKPDVSVIRQELACAGHRRHTIFNALSAMLRMRKQVAAFHPKSGFKILNCSPKLFIIMRGTVDGDADIIAIHNVSTVTVKTAIPTDHWRRPRTDLLSGSRYEEPHITLEPLQVLWLR